MVTFNGSNQNISGATMFDGMTLNNGTVVNLNSDIHIMKELNFVNGKISTGINAVIIVDSASVLRTSGHVNRNMKKYFSGGLNISKFFEIGDSIFYAPVDATLSNVSIAGYLTASTSNTGPDLTGSLLNASKNVNRFWKLMNAETVFDTCNATFTFNTADIDSGANTNNFVVRRNQAASWNSTVTGAKNSTSIQATGLTALGEFAVGELIGYAITTNSFGSGGIAPSNPTIAQGTNQTFTFNPNTGYHIDSVVVDSVNFGAVASYDLTNITSVHTINAYFSINQYAITSSVVGNGTITPIGTINFSHGTNQSYTILPNLGFHIDSVRVDSVNVGIGNAFTFNTIISTHTIAAYFTPNVQLYSEYSADVSTGLLLHFNESSGSTLADYSSNVNNAISVGTVPAVGKLGNARGFSGLSTHVNVPHNNAINFLTGDFTIEAWIKTDTIYAARTQYIFDKRANTSSPGYALTVQPGGTISMATWSPTQKSIGSDVKIKSGKLYHVAGVRKNDTLRVYVNGIAGSQFLSITGDNLNNSGDLKIGARNDTNSTFSFNGKIDEVRISSIARSTNEFNVQPTPINLASSAVSQTDATLNWVNGNGAVGRRTNYIYRGNSSQSLALIDSTTSSTFSQSGLSVVTPYIYGLSTVDSTGYEGILNTVGFYNAIPTTGEYATDVNTALLLHMDESTGSDAHDASGKGNYGVVKGSTIVQGKASNARQFNGTNEFVEISHRSSLNTGSGNFTVEAWVKLDTLNKRHFIVQKRSGTGFIFLVDTTNSLRFFALDQIGNTYGVANGSIILNSGKWYHVAGVRTEDIFSIYVNGKFDQSATIPSNMNLNNEGSLTVGTYFNYDPTRLLKGSIDEVRLSTVSRTPNEFNLQLMPDLAAANAAGTSINLSWTSGGGSAPFMRYRIYRGNDSTAMSLIDSTTNTSYNNAGLTNASTYFYRISAIDSTGFESDRSFARYDTVLDITPPVAPQNLVAMVGDNQVTLNWKPNSEVDFQKYYVYRGTTPNPITIIDSTTNINDTLKTYTGLTNYQQYYFRVAAKDAYGNISSYSNEVLVTPFDQTGLAAPVTLTVVDSFQTSFTLRWNSTIGGDFRAYYIYGGLTPSPEFIMDSTINLTDTVRILKNLSVGKTYYFFVTAIDSNGNESGGSPQVNASPNAPPAMLGEYAPDIYTMLYLRFNELSGDSLYDLSGNANNGRLFGTAVTNGKVFKGRNFDGLDDYVHISNTATLQPQDITTEGWFRFSSNTGTKVLISKTAGSGISESFIVKYESGNLKASIGTSSGQGPLLSAPWTPTIGQWYHIAYTFDDVNDLHSLYVNGKQIATGVNVSTIGYDSHPVLIGAEYENEILSNYFDGEVDEVRLTNRARSSYEFSLPVPPYFLSASPGVNTIDLSWVFDGGYTPLRQFLIYRGADSSSMVLFDSTQNTYYSNTGLTEFSTHYYRVFAVDSTGFISDPTFAAGLTVPDLTPPAVPVILSAVGGDGTINILWSRPVSTDIDRYFVNINGTPYDTTFEATDTSTTLIGLTNGESYYITVIAVDSNDNISTSSDAFYATTNPHIAGTYSTDANTVLLLHFDESTGSVASDHSGKNNYGSGGGTIAGGRFGYARDVLSQNISVADNPSLHVTEGSFTIDTWINVNDSSQSFILFKKRSGSVGIQANMVTDTGTISIQVTDNITNTVSMTSTKKISDGKWHHIALTFNHGSKLMTLYIDGVIDNTFSASSLTGSFDSNNGLQIGPDNFLVESPRIINKYSQRLKSVGNASVMSMSEPSRTVVDEFRISTIVRNLQEFGILLPPISLTASAVNSTSISLTWQAGGGSVPLMKYYIYRGLDSSSMVLIDSTVSITYQNTGLTFSTQYFYRVSGVDSTGYESDKSFAHNATTLTSYAISASVTGNGTITPAEITMVLQGTNQQFVITADPYHHVDSVLVDGNNVDSLSSYTFMNVMVPHTIVAFFSPNVLHHFIVEASGGGTITDPLAGQTFNITTTAVDTFGNVVPSFTGNVWFSSTDSTMNLLGGLYSVSFTSGQHGPQNVTLFTSGYHTISVIDSLSGKKGISDSFYVHPAALNHFTVKDTLGLDIPTQIQNTPFHIRVTAFDNFNNIKTDFVSAVLVSVPGATVTVGNGLTPNFVNGILSVHQLQLSSSGLFSVVVNDSVSEITNSSNSFSVLPDTYTITSSVSNGTISPSGVQSVSYGDTIVFTFTPNFKHHFDSLYIDGQNVMDSTLRYTFVNVIAAHTITAYFSPTLNVPPLFTQVMPDTAIARFDTLQYAYTANDPDSGILRYAIVSAPAGVSIDSITGALKYIPITSAKGQYTVVVKVFDDSLAAVNDTVLVRVNIYGDVSGNGTITSFDGALVLQNSVGVNIFSPLQQRVGDVSGNGGISSLDASYILQHAVGLISSFPGGLGKESRAEAVLSAFSFRIMRGEKQDEYDFIVSVNKPSQVFGIAMSVSFDTTIVKALKMNKTTLTDSMSMAYHFPDGKANLALAGISPLNKAGDILRFTFNLKDPNYPKNAILFTMKKFMLNETDHTNDIGGITLNVRDLAQMPTVYKLEQNFPNPFNPSTTVNYQLPEASMVKIVIYNMLGQEVKTLVNEDQLAGYYSMLWNGTDNSHRKVSSGVYIYRIEALGPQKQRYTEVKKMLMIK